MAERKSLAEIVFIPIVVAVVGIAGTWIITDQQHKNTILLTEQQNRSAEIARKAQIEKAQETAASDRQIKILEIFVEKIQSPEPTQREFALRLLTAVDGELAGKLADAVLYTEAEDNVRKVAEKVKAEAAVTGSSFPVVASRKSFQEAIDVLSELREKTEKANMHYSPAIYLSDNGWYAVTFGGYLPLKEAQARVRYARSSGIAGDAYVRTSRTWGENLISD